MHFLVLNAQERKEGRTEEGGYLCGKEWKGQEMEKDSHHQSQTSRRPSALPLLHPWPWLLFWIQEQWDFQSKKTKHPLQGRGRKGTTASPWERVRINRKSRHLPVCLSSSLCRLRPWSRQKKAPCRSWADPGALARFLKTGEVTLHSTPVTAAAVFPSQFCSIPCSNPMLIADAKKLKY